MPIDAFRLPYSENAVQDLRERLARTRWPDTIPGSGWEYGFDRDHLQSICRYWRETFDWKAELDRLACFHHQRFTTGDQSIHFVYECGTRSGAGSHPVAPWLAGILPGDAEAGAQARRSGRPRRGRA